MEIENQAIKNYQAVVPSTWNAGPRDAQGQRGAYEAALLKTPVADPERPLELLRTIHSFDPCLACAVHVVDARGRDPRPGPRHEPRVHPERPCDDLFSSDTVVVGVGNTILSDDGVGVHAARLLQDDPRVPAGVTILDGGTLGLELMPYVSDASRVLFLDAVNSGRRARNTHPDDRERVTRHIERIERSSVGRGRSDCGPCPDVDRPQDIVVLGVQPANTDWGTSLSPEVEAALPGLTDAAVAQLGLWKEADESK